MTLNGLAGDNSYTINAPQPSYSVINVNGSGLADPNVLTINADFTDPAPVNVALNGDTTGYVFGGNLVATVNFIGVGTVNVNNYNGESGSTVAVGDFGSNNALSVTPTGPNAATSQISGLAPLVNTTSAGALSVLFFGSSDQLVVNGSQYDDTITVNGAAASVLINNAPQGTLQEVDYPIAFTGAASLTVNGNDGSDTFNVTPGAIPIFIDGGNPVGVQPGDVFNLLSGGGSVQFFAGPTSDSGGFQVGADATVSFVHIETIGPIFSPGPVTIDGTNGDDDITIIARDNSYAPGTPGLDGIQDLTVSVNAGPEFLFVDATSLTVNSLSGDDDIVLQTPAPNGAVWDEPVTINGGAPQTLGNRLGDIFTLETPNGLLPAQAQTVTYTPSGPNSGSLDDTTTSATITLTDIEQLFYNGGTMGDAVTLIGSGGGDVFTSTPGATIDAGMLQDNSLLALNYQSLGGGGSVLIQDAGTGNTLVADGTSGDDAFVVSGLTGPTRGQVELNGQLPLQTIGVTGLTLNGLAGDNTYTLTATFPYTTTDINGSGLSDPDVVDLNGNGTAVTVNLGTTSPNLVGGGLGTVDLTGVGVVNLNNGIGPITVSGTTAADAFEVTPTGSSSAAVQVAGAFPLLNATTSGALTIGDTNPADGDTVTVNGTGGNDTIAVLRNATTDTVQVTSPAGALKTISVTSADASGLIVATGTGVDGVTVTGTGGPTLTVLGGQSPASDTLTVTNTTAGTTTVTPGTTSDSGTVVSPDGTINFAGLKSLALTGASAGDTLVANGTNSGDTMALQFLGGANRIWVDSQAVVSFSSFGTVTLNGLFGDDKFNVYPVGLVGVTAINVNGGDPTASDSLVVNGTAGADTIKYTPTAPDAGSVTVNTAATVTFLTTESVTVNGLGGGDALTFVGSGGGDTITSTPGATIDAGTLQDNSLLALNYENLGGGGSVLIQDAGTGNTLVADGTSGDDAFVVSGLTGPTRGQVELNGQLPLQTIGVTGLTLNGLAGDNTYTLTATFPYTTTDINGSGLSDPDVVDLNGNGTLVTASMGTDTPVVMGGGLGTVNISGVGTINLTNTPNPGAVTVTGATAADAFEVTPTTATSAAVQVTGYFPLLNAMASGTLTIDGRTPADGDTVTVNGTGGNDTIAVLRNATTDTVQVTSPAGALKTISVTSADASGLIVATGTGVDGVTVTGTGGPTLTVLGGQSPASDTLTVTNTTAGTTTVTPGTTSDSGTVVSPDGTINFAGMKSLALTGASAGDILVANGTNSGDTMALGANRIWVDSQAVVSFSSFGTVTLNGLFGDDKFNVYPVGLVGVTAINVNGGDPTASDSLVVNGTAGADTIKYTPTAPDAGSVTVNTAATVTFLTTESVTVNGLGGGDALTFVGSGGGDTITSTPGATIDAGTLQDNSLLAAELPEPRRRCVGGHSGHRHGQYPRRQRHGGRRRVHRRRNDGRHSAQQPDPAGANRHPDLDAQRPGGRQQLHDRRAAALQRDQRQRQRPVGPGRGHAERQRHGDGRGDSLRQQHGAGHRRRSGHRRCQRRGDAQPVQ